MEIHLMKISGIDEALFGIGLSYGLTSGTARPALLSQDKRERLKEIASRLCKAGAGEDKFLRQVACWWDVRAPRYWWAEADTFKVGTVAQSESTMHTIMNRNLVQEDFEEPIHPGALKVLNLLIGDYKKSKNGHLFMQLKNDLPEGFLQRRIWTLNLANMKNIYRQRKNHRLPQWSLVCNAFRDATPDFLKGMYE